MERDRVTHECLLFGSVIIRYSASWTTLQLIIFNFIIIDFLLHLKNLFFLYKFQYQLRLNHY